jgi:hypothetical protein
MGNTARASVIVRGGAVLVSLVLGIGAAAATANADVGASSGGLAGALVPGPRTVSGGGDHFCVLTGVGGLKCWGLNFFGELGDGTNTDRSIPTDVSGLNAGVTDVSAGGQTTCAVVGGGAKCWGGNGDGAVGDGTTEQRLSPVDVSGLTTGVSRVSVGYVHSCALTTVGGVLCWGENQHGELGDGTTTDRLTPVSVTGLTSGVAAIATGLDHSHHDHTCALTTVGGVKCWGDNQFGELGDGTTTDRSTPVDVSGATSNVRGIFAGGTATCAVTTTGGASCWGHNDAGQIGDGTTTDRHTPVAVAGLTSGVSTMALSQSSAGEGIGGSHTCAVVSGAVKCWGNNANGQMGDGTAGGNQLTPVDVTGLGSGAVGVGLNFWGGCSVSDAGGVKCWGIASVGDGTSIPRLTPVDVSGSFFRTECPTLIAAPHTTFTMSDGYAIDSVATFGPDAGYLLEGSSALRCSAAGTWDAPPPTASLVPSPPRVVPGVGSVREGDVGTASLFVPVTLSAAGSTTVTVQWNTVQVTGAPGHQADPASDYTPSSGTVTFAAGETAKNVTIPISGDTDPEPDEYIVVSFHDPTNATMGGFWGLGFGVITDDDHPTVLPGEGLAPEGNSGDSTLDVPVDLSHSSTQTVTVQWQTTFVSGADGHQADPASDYTPVSGTVTFNPGETTKNVTIPISGDTDPEPDEYIVVSFHDPTNATMGGFWGLGFGVILNDD